MWSNSAQYSLWNDAPSMSRHSIMPSRVQFWLRHCGFWCETHSFQCTWWTRGPPNPPGPPTITARSSPASQNRGTITIDYRLPSTDGGSPIDKQHFLFSLDDGSSWFYCDLDHMSSCSIPYQVSPVIRVATRSHNQFGWSWKFSDNAGLLSRFATVPTPPWSVYGAATSDVSVNVSWTEPMSNQGAPVVAYRVHLLTASGDHVLQSITTPSTSRGALFFGLSSETQYTVTVAAQNTMGWSSPQGAYVSTSTAVCNPGCHNGDCRCTSGTCKCSCNFPWGTSSWDTTCRDISAFLLLQLEEAISLAFHSNSTAAMAPLEEAFSFYDAGDTALYDDRAKTLWAQLNVTLTNLRNGMDITGHASDYVGIFQWSEYQKSLESSVAFLRSAETRLTVLRGSTVPVEVAAAQLAGAVQSTQAQIASTTLHLHAVERTSHVLAKAERGLYAQIVKMQQGVGAALRSFVSSQQLRASNAHAAIQREIAKDKQEAWKHIFSDVFDFVKDGISLVASASAVVLSGGLDVEAVAGMAEDAFDMGKDVMDVIHQAKAIKEGTFSNDPVIQKEYKDIGKYEEKMKDAQSLAVYVQQFVHLVNMLENCMGTSVCVANATSILPALQTTRINSAALRSLFDSVKSTFTSSNAAAGGATVVRDMENMLDLVAQHLVTVKNWYQSLQSTQLLHGQMHVLQDRQVTTLAINRSEANQLLTINATESLVRSHMSLHWLVVLRTAHDMIRQFDYTTLKSNTALLTTLSLDRASASLASFLAQVDSALKASQTGQFAIASAPCWIEYVCKDPAVLAALATNGTGVVNVPLPPNVTNFFNVRLVNNQAVQAYLDVAQPQYTSLVVTHTGTASLYDQSFQRHTYATQPHPVSFVYTKNQNALTHASMSPDADGDTFIRLAPFGAWQITVDPLQPPLHTLAGLTSVRLQFFVDYQNPSPPNAASIWGVPGARTCISHSKRVLASTMELRAPCPNNCSARGTCRGGLCSCSHPWTGVNCATNLRSLKGPPPSSGHDHGSSDPATGSSSVSTPVVAGAVVAGCVLIAAAVAMARRGRHSRVATSSNVFAASSVALQPLRAQLLSPQQQLQGDTGLAQD